MKSKVIAMERKITAFLHEWKNSPARKPLILQGARQVGKTYSILEFGRSCYDNVAYFNFENDPALTKTFEEGISPATLLPLLANHSGQSIIPGRTLIVFDEVQLCERAVTSLKYFCEEAPQHHIIAAGSLLGIAVNRAAYSFPVGKVDIRTMFPMDIEEFFLAMGHGDLVHSIREHFDSCVPLPHIIHETATRLYRQYLVVGGMPECVRLAKETGDFLLIRNAQKNILTGYLDDMSKYNQSGEIKKTRLAYDSITTQLSKRNTRFLYKLVKKGGRAAEFENAIEWLLLSGIVNQVFRVEHVMKPLENYKDIDAFKIYVSDCGLLCAKKDISADDVLFMNSELNDFKGGMTENYVNTQLTASGHSMFYWEASGGTAEIDFIIQRGGSLIPIEVKSSDNTRSKSLQAYINRYHPDYAVKLSVNNFMQEGVKRFIPLYAAFCL